LPKRLDIKAILADPEKRRDLMVESIIAIQAREGRDITRERAEEVYDQARKERE
jgi:hypothetical protein